MNGTMWCRTQVKIPEVQEDLFLRHKYYYSRRGIEDFLRALHESGSFVICAYSSMTIRNLKAGLAATVANYEDYFDHLLDRSYNKKDPSGENPWDTIRDMEKIWSSQKFLEFGPKNTVLLDNEARKFEETPRNGILVKEYGPREVLNRDNDTLKTLQEFLMQLARDKPRDVREYLEEGKSIGYKVIKSLRPDRSDIKAPEEVDPKDVLHLLGKMQLTDQPDSATAAPKKSEASAELDREISVHFVRIADSEVTMQNFEKGITVKIPLSSELRIEKRMDLQRLKEENFQGMRIERSKFTTSATK